MEIQVDEDGWAAIHHCVAAEKELLMSIEKFVNVNPESLEFETRDQHRRTPLLLAVHYNKRKSVEKLLELGAYINAIDNNNHGIVQICVMDENVNMLHYFIDQDYEGLDVWKNLVKFLEADTDEEVEKVSLMLDRLTTSRHVQESDSQCSDPHWQQLMNSGGIPKLIKACRSVASSAIVKKNIAQVLNNIVCHGSVVEALVKSGAVEVLLDLVNSNVKPALEPSFQCLEQIAKFSADYAKKIQTGGFLSNAAKLCCPSSHLPSAVVTNVVLIVGHIAVMSDEARKTVGSTPSLMENLIGLFDNPEYQTCIPLLTALTHSLENIVSNNAENQNLCIDAGGATHLIVVSRANKYPELQINAIKALFSVTADNQYASSNVLEEGAVMPLMQLLRKSRSINLQEVIARTLWALAGPDSGEKRSMAAMMGVNLLIEFLSAQGENSDNLNCIGCDGLAVLAQGALNKKSVINEANGITPLCRLLRFANPVVVKSALRALRHLCLNIGYIPNTQNQTAIAQTHGLKFLVALLAHSRSEDIQVEAALTLGAAVLGNKEIMESLNENPDFTYLHIIRLLYSDDEMVKLTAANALATFSFNNVTQQREIAESGGVRWHNFAQFLQSKDYFFVVNAAFQAVVMSLIIPDEDPAISSAESINKLVEALEVCQSDDIKALAADCVARLAHTRAGVPAAMVAINVIWHLCKLLKSSSEQVRGCAAVALGYLSFNHTAERHMLRMCRDDPYLIHVIKYYTKNFKLSPSFLENWKHCVHVGMNVTHQVKSSDVMENLSQNISALFMKSPKEISTPLITLTEDYGTTRSHNPHSSRTSQLHAIIHDDSSQIYGRASHSSRITRRSEVTSNVRSYVSHEVVAPSVNNSVDQVSDLSLLAQD